MIVLAGNHYGVMFGNGVIQWNDRWSSPPGTAAGTPGQGTGQWVSFPKRQN